MLNPRKPAFKITPKGKTVDHEFLNPMATVFFMICLLNLVGIGFAVVKWAAYPLFRDVILIAFAWCLYNTILGIITLGAFWERQQLRQHHRVRAKGIVDLRFAGGAPPLSAAFHDLSLTGIGVELDGLFPSLHGGEVQVEATDSYGVRHALHARVRSSREHDGRTFMGIEFVLNDATYPGIVNFVYGDSRRWAEILADRFRPVHSLRFTARDMYHFLQRGVRGSYERILYLAKAALPAAGNALRALAPRLQAYHARLKRSESLP
ncbi:MAG: PilZ domain-containing protein, partial [Actinomycetota bacterium]|nr:PilZ domain-containing protein [Actinomycetota bacterium]